MMPIYETVFQRVGEAGVRRYDAEDRTRLEDRRKTGATFHR
jgi:hypothetical protein